MHVLYLFTGLILRVRTNGHPHAEVGALVRELLAAVEVVGHDVAGQAGEVLRAPGRGTAKTNKTIKMP